MSTRSWILALVILGFVSAARADGLLLSWSPTDLDGMTAARWDAAKQRTCKDVIALDQKVASWPDAYEVALGADANASCKELIAALVAQLADGSVHKLDHTRRLIIWDRIANGDIVFEGKGLQIDDDLFTAAGRANWLLRTLLKKNFGPVAVGANKEALAALQARWKKSLAGESVVKVAEAFPTAKRGFTELHSLAAINALIISLQPSPAKDDVTKHCLKTVYQLDQMPTDPNAQARMCDPDTSTNNFLAVVTSVVGSHPADWWASWWKTNGTRLTWSPDQAKFLAPP